jgi:hypothetical protein
MRPHELQSGFTRHAVRVGELTEGMISTHVTAIAVDTQACNV